MVLNGGIVDRGLWHLKPMILDLGINLGDFSLAQTDLIENNITIRRYLESRRHSLIDWIKTQSLPILFFFPFHFQIQYSVLSLSKKKKKLSFTWVTWLSIQLVG